VDAGRGKVRNMKGLYRTNFIYFDCILSFSLHVTDLYSFFLGYVTKLIQLLRLRTVDDRMILIDDLEIISKEADLGFYIRICMEELRKMIESIRHNCRSLGTKNRTMDLPNKAC
jgi:hypothetical protein